MTRPPRPTGPIWVDFSEQIMGLPIKDAVLLCNLALNQLKLDKLAEIAFDADLRIDFQLRDPGEGSKPDRAKTRTGLVHESPCGEADAPNESVINA